MKNDIRFDTSRKTSFDRKMLYGRVVFWVFLSILSLEVIILTTSYYIFYNEKINLIQQTGLLIGLGCLLSTVITIAVIGVLHWYILLHANISYEGSEEPHELLMDLYRAIDHNELELYYQPQINMNTEKIVGMETLIRWNHPTKGLISPTDFIPLAEQSGLIFPIGSWALKTACIQTKKWNDKGHNLRVAINISPMQFKAEIVPEVLSVIDISGLEPHNIELEITETAMFDNMEHAIEIMGQLNDIGVGVSMDDFGTGYSSLAHLDRFPVSKIKIDKAFVHKINPYDEEPNIADSIIRMGHRLNLTILAEGIETEYQKNYFKALKCDEAQGYYFGKPMPARRFIKLVKDHKL